MQDNSPETTGPSFSESVAALIQGAPQPIQDFLRSNKHETAVAKLSRAHALHVDQASVLERDLLLMLLGAESPEEFAQALKNDAHLPEDTVGKILTEVNQRVFTPLHEQIRAVTESTPPSASATVSAPAAAQSTSPQTAPPADKRPARPPVLPGQEPDAEVAAGFPPTPLEKATPEPTPAAPVTTAPSPTSEPEPERPRISAIPDTPAPSTQPAAAAPTAPKPLVKEYATDPYREPVE